MVERGIFRRQLIWSGPQPRLRRSLQIALTSQGGVSRGLVSGLELRSSRPEIPSSAYLLFRVPAHVLRDRGTGNTELPRHFALGPACLDLANQINPG